MPPTELLLLRLSGDISTKSRRTRLRFARRLAANLRDSLTSAGIGFRIERQWSRLFVESDQPQEALKASLRVFGVHSASPAQRREWETLEDLVAAGAEVFAPAVRGRRFAVRARRSGDRGRIPFRSPDVERHLGRALLAGAAGVDLDAPEVTAHVEVHPRVVYLFTRKVPASGGLPVGVEGRALSLVSGGFDSAVASWLMLKRGVGLDYLFFNLGGSAHEEGALRVAKVIADGWSFGERPQLHAVDFRDVVGMLRERARPRYWQVLLKRLMLRAAAVLSHDGGFPALVTGEAMGQVSSQTLQNLAVISRATTAPVLRPLLGFNKEEIIDLSRRIGTYELSAAVGEYCAILPRHPVTHASLPAVEAEERSLELDLAERAVAERRVFDLRSLAAEEIGNRELEVEAMPDGATVLDLRSRPAYASWHHPGAARLDFARALKAYPSFDRSRTYVLYCEVGLKSAHLAERMRQDGFDAYHVRGGVKRLIRRAAEDPVRSALLAPALLTD